ncbi:acylneuraminate cytidylyltransferase family protein [Litorivicinus sp.]|nr:acylneuraminate cytidylyltransferase family protein [Litorivicinus sp.]
MFVLAVIPARGGSKGLLKKNVRELCGKPLIAYPIKYALQSKYISDLIVSTDSPEIAKVAEQYGAKVPFMRPEELSGDLTTTEATLQHALLEYEKNFDQTVDLCVFLTATDAIRASFWIDEAIEKMMFDDGLESVFVGHPTHKNYWVQKDSQWVRVCSWMSEYSSRQIRQPVIREDTGLTCVSRAHLWREGRRIGDNVEIILNTDSLSSVDIHSETDLALAEFAVNLRSGDADGR